MRRGAVVAGLVGYAVLLVVLRPLTGQPGQQPAGDWWLWLTSNPEQVLVLVLSCAAWLMAAWLFVVTGLSLAATMSGAGARLAQRLVQRITPFAIRRTLEAAIATALAVGPAGAAAAGPAAAVGQPAPTATASTLLAPLPPVPDPIVAPPAELDIPDLDRPSAVLPVRAPPAVAKPPPAKPVPTKSVPVTTPAPAASASHLVVAGDTLWGVAAEALPAVAGPAEVTRSWQQCYASNRSTIGPDPGLIRPGELLVAPSTTATAATTSATP
jgi:resuscitation-promoting factor RpfA